MQLKSLLIKNYFQELSKKRGINTLTELAERLDVSQGRLSQIIRNESIPQTTTEQILKTFKDLDSEEIVKLCYMSKCKFKPFRDGSDKNRNHTIIVEGVNFRVPYKLGDYIATLYNDEFEYLIEDVEKEYQVFINDENENFSPAIIEKIPSETTQVPFFMSKVNAGKGISFETAPAKVDVSNYVLNSKDPKEVFIVEVSGNSMNQAGIIDGSTIIVKRSQDQKECINKVCVLTYQGETLVKYLLRETIDGKDVLVLRSKSTENHKDIIVNYPEELILHGYVVTVATNF